MSDSRLLPTGSSPLEVAAAKACAEIEKTPVSIRELWNPDTCPANLLPWLAWAFSVDRWMKSGRKRQNAPLSAMPISSTVIKALSAQSGVWWSRSAISLT